MNGSFECACMSGYELQINGIICEGKIARCHEIFESRLFSFADIDECLIAAITNTDLCQDDVNAQCVNLVGSYECVCVPGFERVNGTCQCE